MTKENRWSIADAVLQRVVELEYTPPEDFPEDMLMCTQDELRIIVEEETAYPIGPARATPLTAKEETPLTEEQKAVLADFEREMQDVVIPQILKDRARRWAVSVATKDLPLGNTVDADTWRELHNAWRKRAEEAEAELNHLRSSQPSSSSGITEAIKDVIRQTGSVIAYQLGQGFNLIPVLDAVKESPEYAALESLYLEQLQEIERLNRRLDEWQEAEASVCPEDWGFVEYIKHLGSSLKDSQLTELERQFILENLDHGKFCSPPKDCVCGYFGIIGRLRALSTKGTAD